MSSAEPDLLRLAGQLITGTWSRTGDPAESLSDLFDTVIGSGFCRFIGVGQLDTDFPPGAGRHFATLFATDNVVQTADDLQNELGQGPHFHSGTGHAAVICPDLGLDGRWPQWSANAVELGLHAVLSIPLRVGLLGMIDLYPAEPRPFRRPDLELAGLVASHTATLLTRLHQRRGYWPDVDARRQVGQAQGILMASGDLDATRAFHVLQALADRDHTSIARAAAQLIGQDRQDRPGPDPTGGPLGQ